MLHFSNLYLLYQISTKSLYLTKFKFQKKKLLLLRPNSFKKDNSKNIAYLKLNQQNLFNETK